MAQLVLSSGPPDGRYVINFWRPPAAKVTLVSRTIGASDASLDRVVAQVVSMYSGQTLDQAPTDEEASKMLHELDNTALKTPLEMLNFTFLIEGVTRAFTHQLVRHRIGASYVQQSLRFLGAKDTYNVLLPKGIVGERDVRMFAEVAGFSIQTYDNWVRNENMASQDARAILPIHIMTNIFVSFSFTTLMSYYRQRMCCQAQLGEHQTVLIQMQRIINNISPRIADFLSAPWQKGKSCGYGASFDRPCTWIGKKWQDLEKEYTDELGPRAQSL